MNVQTSKMSKCTEQLKYLYFKQKENETNAQEKTSTADKTTKEKNSKEITSHFKINENVRSAFKLSEQIRCHA